jgi:rhamnose transport system permease protein
VRRHQLELGVAVLLGLLLLALGFAAPTFFQAAPLRSLITREAPTLVVVCGVACVIIARQIDISVGSQFSVCSVVAGSLAASNHSMATVLLAAMACGLTFGLLNGALIAGLGLPSIVVTLGTMVALRQGLNLLQQGEFINLPDRVQWFGMDQMPGQWTVIGAGVLVLVLMACAARWWTVGRQIFAVGSDAEAARLAGIRPRLVTCGVFALMGVLCGFAALLNIVQSPQVQPLAGSGLELKAIAAVIVGGVAISGGRGSLWGAALGLLLLACISPALVHFHVEAYWEKAIQGAIILVAAASEAVPGRRRRFTTGTSP